MLECRCTAALGAPVEPEEYSQKHASSAVVGAGGKSGEPLASASLKAICPAAALPDTITCFRHGSFPMSGVKCFSRCPDTTSVRERLSESMCS